MTATTHYAFSYLLCAAAGIEPATAAAASLLSLLPDIDHPESTIGRVFRPVSKKIQQKYGHRTVTHSLFAIMVISAALLPLLLLPRLLQWGGPFWTGLYGAALLAFSSHIFIDLFNKSGVRFFAPFSQKEYISFRTPSLRILVSSWQEYILLFVIVFFAFTVTGEGFSIHKAVRSVGKMIYKNYDNAVKDYQENSAYLCMAHVEYFDNIERRILVEDLQVLNMYPQTGVFLRNNERLVIGKENINEITVDKTEKKVITKRISGSDPALLKSIPNGSYLSGTIDVKNYFPELKSNSFITVDRRSDGASFILKCAAPWEISRILNLHNEISVEVEKLKKQLCSYQISQLRGEESELKKRIETLRKKGLYNNYGRISRLTDEVKKVQSKIGSLEMKESMGGDAELQEKIILLTNGFHFWFDLVVFEI
jgi:inner membrane protein